MTSSSPAVPDGDLLAKHPDRIAGMFDAIAARYDFLNHLLSGGLDVWWRRRAIASLALCGNETLLDVCAGTADLAIAAVVRRRVSRAIAVDFAEEMLRVGQKKVGGRNLSRFVRLVRGDATSLPIARGTVDGATIAFGIRNVVRPDAACAELYRVLRPAGRIAILEFGLPRMPPLRGAYLWYFRKVLPRVGRAISGHSAAYSYLPASVDTFPSPDAFSATLRNTGFRDVRAEPLTFGIVYLYTAAK